MAIIYRISKVGKRIKYKLRHHRGHGVHSPFVFNFINNVIEEKYSYYAYDDVAKYLKENQIEDYYPKINRLIFRIINKFNPQNVIVKDELPLVLNLYIRAISQYINIINLSQKANQTYLFDELKYNKNCIFLNFRSSSLLSQPSLDEFVRYISPQSFIIIDGIRTNKDVETFWNKLIRDQRIRISLDLYHLGILFFDTKYCKQNYKLSF